jgi:DNA repair exonuclease SbcCD ATPase subunit
MAQIRLKRLSLRAFRSFIDEAAVEFPESGLVLFRGFNEDTGGSSGAGKSTILLALTYLLGFCKYPRTALQSWLTEDPLQVVGVFETSEGELQVTRGQGLKLSLNGVGVEGSVKQLETKLQQALGLGPDLMAALTYRGQKSPGLFLSKTDSERKEFLTQLLGLERFETAQEVSQKKAKDLEPAVTVAKALLGNLAKELESAKQINPPALKDEMPLKETLDRASGEAEGIRSQVFEIRHQIKERELGIEAEAQRRYKAAKPEQEKLEEAIEVLKKDQHLQAISLESPELTQMRANSLQAEQFLVEIKAEDANRKATQAREAAGVLREIISIEQELSVLPSMMNSQEAACLEIHALERSTCPTCDREWIDSKATLALEKAQGDVLNLGEQIETFEALKPERDALRARHQQLQAFIPNPQLEQFQAIVTDLQKKVAVEIQNLKGQRELVQANAQKLVAEAEARLQSNRAAVAHDIEMYRHDSKEGMLGLHDRLENLSHHLTAADSAVKGCQNALHMAKVDNAREQERHRAAQERLERLQKSCLEAEEQAKKAETELAAELDFQRLIGREGFLGSIFDEVLAEISQETNCFLARFPNTAHVSLHWRSESTTQKGAIKKNIIPVVSIGGFEAPLAAGLSGGMESAVELAVDLAVATVVSRRTGTMPNWMVLDESFTGLGPVESEGCMEMLQAISADRLILVVDHASETKSMFTQFVDVKYKNGRSTL